MKRVELIKSVEKSTASDILNEVFYKLHCATGIKEPVPAWIKGVMKDLADKYDIVLEALLYDEQR